MVFIVWFVFSTALAMVDDSSSNFHFGSVSQEAGQHIFFAGGRSFSAEDFKFKILEVSIIFSSLSSKEPSGSANFPFFSASVHGYLLPFRFHGVE